MWLNTKTEYSFGRVYGRVDNIVKKLSTMADYAGIADLGNTFGHVAWDKACKKHGIKPVFGVQLPVVKELQTKKRRYSYNYMTFIARNNEGLAEIYKLIDLAYKQFYYREQLSYEQVNKTSENIAILSGIACKWDLTTRDIRQELSLSTPQKKRECHDILMPGSIDNYYLNSEDRFVYESFTDQFKRERKTSLTHIPTEKEWLAEMGGWPQAIENIKYLASQCDATLPIASMIKWKGKETLKKLCEKRWKKIGQWPKQTSKYFNRFEKELKVIKEKNFEDYFLVVADLVKYAKTKMCVGPARGSAAGSLICYLLGITEVDPIKYGLYFERFIDLNRSDLPDIDIDFQDNKRYLAIKYLEKKYGSENVAQIANISRLKPKSSLNRFAKAFHIPLDEIEEIKNISENLQDTFNNSEIGKAFLKKYPQMAIAAKAEGHALHTSVHAAGVLVCPQKVSNYCGINSRDKKRIAMIDKRDAEKLNLLKIDILGLRTLSIIAETCDAIGKSYNWIYDLPTDDQKTFELFNQHRFSGIFQFEGEAVKKLAQSMPIENIEDISALSALGRPGPLASGAAWNYVHARSGRKEIKWISQNSEIKEATKETFGVIVYQEQVMRIVREIGGFSWKDTGAVRKAIAKSKGDKIQQFKEAFVKGANMSEKEAVHIWKQIETFGGYAFNKSHAVSYALISYYCAYLKAHYPLEFTMSCLNNAKDDSSALKILRDAVENDGIQYQHIHPSFSMQKWSIMSETYKGNTLIGGFLSIKGIGPASANKIVKFRKEKKPLPAGIQKHLTADESPFKYLYPAKELYGDYYKNYQNYNLENSIWTIKGVKEAEDDDFNIIGKLIEKTGRDANEAQFVAKRDGQYLEGQTAYLLLTLEDDTGEIRCKISIDDYNRLGHEIAENGQKDKDWYLVHGKKINNWDILFVKNIRRITND